MRIYFAHPMSSYGTDVEDVAMGIIAKTFPDAEIVNPNQAMHQNNGKGRFAYFEALVQSCDGIVYLAFPDGKIGAGIAGECKALLTSSPNGSIYEIDILRGDCVSVAALDYARVLDKYATAERNRRAPYGTVLQR